MLKTNNKSKFRFILLFFSLFMVAQVAFPCGGSYPVCGMDDMLEMSMDAFSNCCEGSTLIFQDVCGGGGWVMVVPDHGENSSCAP